MNRTLVLTLALAISGIISSDVYGGVDVEFWNLKTSISERIDGIPINNSETITAISNPLMQTIHAQVNDNSFSTASFDYEWSPSLGTGQFNSTVTHAIRAPQSRAVSTALIRFFPTEDVRVTISGTAQYSHTPGDLSSVNFAAGFFDGDTIETIHVEFERGGNFYFEPASGTLSYFAELVLQGGTLYQYQYSVDSSNTADLPPTGIIDATANISFRIEPVPEPTSLILFLLGASLVLCRTRQSVASTITR